MLKWASLSPTLQIINDNNQDKLLWNSIQFNLFVFIHIEIFYVNVMWDSIWSFTNIKKNSIVFLFSQQGWLSNLKRSDMQDMISCW